MNSASLATVRKGAEVLGALQSDLIAVYIHVVTERLKQTYRHPHHILINERSRLKRDQLTTDIHFRIVCLHRKLLVP